NDSDSGSDQTRGHCFGCGEITEIDIPRAGIRIVIVLLVTDVIWKLASTLIDSQMAVASRSEQGEHHDGPDARRRQRL
ncbi:hypothetical protein ACC685_38970, partial [Rhizobium ruizarguesonis]